MNVEIKSDITGAKLKIAVMKAVPRAQKRNLTEWGAGTVLALKEQMRGGAGSFGFFKRTPQELSQRLGMKVVDNGPLMELTIGTGGFVGKDEAVYAAIQERGGTITPKGHPYLTIPFPGVKGRAANFPDAFFLETRKGLFLVQQSWKKVRGGQNSRASGLEFLFTLKRSVTLPARHWFSRPINARLPELQRTMSPESIWATANALAQGYRGQGG